MYHSNSHSDYVDSVTYDMAVAAIVSSTSTHDMAVGVTQSSTATVSVGVSAVSELATEVSQCCCPCVGDDTSMRHRATSSSSQVPESCDSLRRGPDENSGAVISRMVSIWTSGVVGPLHVNDAALDGVALVSQAVTNASCGDVTGVRDDWLSMSACDRES